MICTAGVENTALTGTHEVATWAGDALGENLTLVDIVDHVTAGKRGKDQRKARLALSFKTQRHYTTSFFAGIEWRIVQT